MLKTIFVAMILAVTAKAAYIPPLNPQPVTQGGGAWAQNLTQLAGSSFSASNALPARLTNGTSYIDPTLIRALTSADVVSAVQSGTWTVAVSNALLPTGAATSALQTSGNATLTAISGQLPGTLGSKTSANSLAVNIASDQTVPVSATALPLPAGAATSALQTTGNTSLSSLDTKTPALGQGTMAASSPVVIASNQSAISVAASVPAAVATSNAAVTVGTTAVRLVSSGTTPAATRRKLVFMASTGNTGNCYYGGSNLAVANGINAFPGAITTFDNDANDYYAICDTAAQSFFVMEVK
jgi:hypothetical protein